jgi:hypothetical protein
VRQVFDLSEHAEASTFGTKRFQNIKNFFNVNSTDLGFWSFLSNLRIPFKMCRPFLILVTDEASVIILLSDSIIRIVHHRHDTIDVTVLQKLKFFAKTVFQYKLYIHAL